MGLNAWAAALFAIAFLFSCIEFHRTRHFGSLAIGFTGLAVAVAFYAQGVNPMLHP